MAQWMTFFLVASAAIVFVAESRVIPAEPISVMLDAYGNPVVFLREKRTPVHPYPQRAMMITGYYRPVRRTSNGGQATGVFAQGNAVSGEAFFGGMQTPHLENGPEPIQEPEVSSAEAQAAPGADESYNEEGEQPQVQEEERYNPEVHHHEEQHPQQEEHHHQEHHDEHHHHEHHDEHHQEEEQHQGPQPGQEQADPEPVPTAPATPATPAVPAEEPVQPNPEVAAERPKVHQGKKTKKTPVVVDEDDEEYEEEDEEPVVPFVPFKGNRRRQGYPNLNNFFPMVFSFPGASTRSGSSGSPPGTITAIANSYSTGKGGVASSVATAYGGSPNGKKRRTPTVSEE